MANDQLPGDSIETPTETRSSGGFLRSILDFFGSKPTDVSLRESLEEAIEEHEEGSNAGGLGDREREMLFNVLEYGELRVNDVMVPRGDIVAVPNEISFQDLVKIFAEAAHSRMPVFRDTLDDVIGMVHVKDTLKLISDENDPDSFKMVSIRRPVLYVPASMRVIDLLAKMRTSRTHMAVVVDEYGGTDGLVTVEDVVEEIVGEIEDEHDVVEEPELVPLSSGGFDADARIDIDELEEALGLDLTPDERAEDVDTLGGLVFLLADRVPDIGEVILHESGYRFEVLDADPRRIRRVRIHSPNSHTPRALPSEMTRKPTQSAPANVVESTGKEAMQKDGAE